MEMMVRVRRERMELEKMRNLVERELGEEFTGRVETDCDKKIEASRLPPKIIKRIVKKQKLSSVHIKKRLNSLVDREIKLRSQQTFKPKKIESQGHLPPGPIKSTKIRILKKRKALKKASFNSKMSLNPSSDLGSTLKTSTCNRKFSSISQTKMAQTYSKFSFKKGIIQKKKSRNRFSRQKKRTRGPEYLLKTVQHQFVISKLRLRV
ncbi:unnamed protein product [Moneuplotes crassus]|uniref:Uncharacterized protein n=1 Tax=Euplotes crassus TaxID=5936 RepID=A0AAD2DBK6_EUPCR|nr:unnamed protein product [Moneuplotes crassus]